MKIPWRVKNKWRKFWMAHSGYTASGRVATMLGSIGFPPYYSRVPLSNYSPRGYVSPKSTIVHHEFTLGKHAFIDDRVLVFQAPEGGAVQFGDYVRIMRDCIFQTGDKGSINIGRNTTIQPRNIMSAYCGNIQIGEKVQIAPNCSIYSYNHSFEPGKLIWDQPLYSKGGVVIGDDCWLGVGCAVLDGVTIGDGAVIGAGSVVNSDIPAGHIACGTPAKVIRKR